MKGRTWFFTQLCGFMLLACSTGQEAAFANGPVGCISRNLDGSTANGSSFAPSISNDGRYVVFASVASDLVAEDNNGFTDVFLKDAYTKSISRISMGIGGLEANGPSFNPSISGDGSTIAFSSSASNLVPTDDGRYSDIFVVRRSMGSVSRASVNQSGGNPNGDSYTRASLSETGRFVAFSSRASNLVHGDTNGVSDIFVRDMDENFSQRVSLTESNAEANGFSTSPSISADGTRIAFDSVASNLVVTDDNTRPDVFVRDVTANRTMPVSANSDGTFGNEGSSNPAISSDGSMVVFDSRASNLSDTDGNGNVSDIFGKRVSTGEVELLSLSPRGQQIESGASFPSLSENGRFVAFEATPSKPQEMEPYLFRNVFVYEIGVASRLVSHGPLNEQSLGTSASVDLSASGSSIVFSSFAENLVLPDGNLAADIFLASL